MKLNNRINGQLGREEELETKGVWRQYGSLRVLLARAGGSNEKYNKALAKYAQELQGILDFSLLPEGKALGIFQKVYAETVVLDWEDIDTETKEVLDENGNPVECTAENVLEVFKQYPELWTMIRRDAENFSTFKKRQTEELIKN